MKTLIIARHAKSNWSANYNGDINRPITEAAHQRAASGGKVLVEKNIAIDFALVSPALRTQQTFAAIEKGYGKTIDYEIKSEIYHGELKKILKLVQDCADQYQTIMLVGHEPTCSFFSEQLLEKVDREIIFRTSTLAKINFKVDHFSQIDWMNGKLDWIIRPK